ncbi:MAG TPA: O-antigen ligase family protein, partial [Steroidobacteraceae bacterium]|nr:O-antigen ligase family protein [Steroidobacteraceae bacterium]
AAPAGGATARMARVRGGLLPLALIALLFFIMVVPQGLDYSPSDAMPAEGDPVSRTIWLLLLGGGLYLCARRSAQARALLGHLNPAFLLFVALASASLLWSIAPDYTLRRLIRLYTVVLVCLGFVVSGWRPGRFQWCILLLLTLLLAASAVFCYAAPDLAIHHDVGHPELMNAWHGITTGKNVLGSLASCAVVMWLHALLTRQTGRIWAIAGGALAMLCLVMSRSSTSLMATVFAVLFMLLLLRSPSSFRRSMPYIVGTFAVAVLVYALAVLRLIPGMDVLLTPVTLLTGKDLTFTGRTDIWYVLNLHIRQHPWLGTGYGAYWIGPVPTSPSYDMLARLFFYPTEGHNGYLDVINDLGLVGGACLMAYFARYIGQSLDLMRLDRAQGALYLALIFRGFLADMSESHWFSVLSIDFVIFTLATFSLAQEYAYAHARARPAARPAPGRPVGGVRRFGAQLPSRR